MNIAGFINRWAPSAGERANKDSFLKELCHVLDLPEPEPKLKDPAKDRYVFERDVFIQAPDGKATTHFIDLYREGCFVLEAKQTAERAVLKPSNKPPKAPSTLGWENEMEKARTQAVRYALNVTPSPPCVIVCDIARCFDLYASFDGSARYQPFPIPERKRIPFGDLAVHAELLRTLWLDPHSLDPSRKAKEVSEEVAASLAGLATDLEKAGHAPEFVAEFLMRCVFTMFAEDVGLLENKLFTNTLETKWIPKPHQFGPAIEHLWRAMNLGSMFGMDKLLRFNGGLFEHANALPMNADQLRKLHVAAQHDWSKVEPAIFGTLLEKALSSKERHKLGAHYTPRAYVERLVRPTVEEPIRDEWNIVRVEVYRFRELGKADEAKEALKQFHSRLTQIKVLDPACGTGNFLYVTLDILKQIESEVLAELRELGETQQLLDINRVSPAQLYGIELNPRAKAIAELVLWIGHLQWHYKVHGRLRPPPEPVLQDLRNIECRDAILAWDGEPVLEIDEKGKPKSRWDGETYKKSLTTGESVPDEMARVSIFRYVNPRRAEWPKAEFIVGNPPFIGTRRMRLALGDGYVQALGQAIPEVSREADFVMFWWNKAAQCVASGETRRLGLITTNSIAQSFNRSILENHLSSTDPVSIVFAIPDHPWIDTVEGAAVRVAMTVAAKGQQNGILLRVESENDAGELGTVNVTFAPTVIGRISQDLRVGASPAMARAIRSNGQIAYWGAKFYGDGFILEPTAAKAMASRDGGGSLARPFMSARDFTSKPRGLWVIDCDELKEADVREQFPSTYQHLLQYVKPLRDQNPRAMKRERWWILGENQPGMRRAVAALPQYIATPETAKHRVFSFIPRHVLAEGGMTVIALEDAFFLGVLSSRVHVVWALAAGGRLGVGNDPRYNKTRCFDPFPFPVATEPQQARIRKLGEQLDSHRKRQQAAHPELTITGMYNVLEKLRNGEALNEKERIIHEQGLVSVLKQLHDELNAAVFDAYGWPHDLSDEQILEKLVALNAERAEEERNGTIRWLRPEFQNPSGAQKPTNLTMPGTEDDGESDEEKPAPAATTTTPWPKRPGERIAAIRDLVLGSKRVWRTEEVASSFKGAKRTDVEDFLDSLAGIGVLVAYGDAGKDLRWGPPVVR